MAFALWRSIGGARRVTCVSSSIGHEAGMSQPKFCLRCGNALVPVILEERTRLRCSSDDCAYVHYGNPTPVVAAIVQLGEDVILARNKGWPEGMYGLVTGFLEANETAEEGALREVQEELSLEGEVRSLVGVYAFPQRNEIIIAYHVEARGEPVVGEELAGIKRVPIAKLRPWPFATGDAVRDWLAKRSA